MASKSQLKRYKSCTGMSRICSKGSVSRDTRTVITISKSKNDYKAPYNNLPYWKLVTIVCCIILRTAQCQTINATNTTTTPAPSITSSSLLQSDVPSTTQNATSPPSLRPTTQQPSSSPTLRKTGAPSGSPTVSPRPTVSPMPSYYPTVSTPFIEKQLFRQQFLIPAKQIFNSSEQASINRILSGYTPRYEPNAINVDTNCTINPDSDGQTLSDCIDSLPECANYTSSFTNDVDFLCTWNSSVTDVTNYQQNFLNYLNSNLQQMTIDMRRAGISVTIASTVRPTSRETTSPTGTPRPSYYPSAHPTVTPKPSALPTGRPSSPIPSSSAPSAAVTFPPPTMAPTLPPSNQGLPVSAIVGLVVAFGLLALVGLLVLLVCAQKRKRRNESQYSSRNLKYSSDNRYVNNNNSIDNNNNNMMYDPHLDAGVVVAMSPSDSLASKRSLISEGDSHMGAESADEMDGTKHLQDEFDKYKDQNLEKLRTNVEGNLAEFEGIMSAVLTQALMSGAEDKVDPSILAWGCDDHFDGYEIEASVLCDVNDWIKRNENATLERKRQFMEELLNRMVASVRHGYLVAQDASRTIHEAAAMLGLPLANELPMTTMIVSGMRKTVNALQMTAALHEFGDVDTAAVASGQRGFGIVRFRQTKAVDRALRRYKNSEIVVQDVDVQIHVLRPSGVVESRSRFG